MSLAVEVDNVHKRFRLYDERNQSLKATLLRGRRARYREFKALEGVSTAVEHGSTVAFIGHNGSGKSTLLKCVARILRPDTGSVRVEGKLSALLELGAGFHPELSGRENVYLNGSILGMSKKDIDARFDDIVAFSGLETGFIDSPVKSYSSGMYVRLGFSVAINVDPAVLLVDEVLAVGDESFQQRCNEKFADLREAGTTIVIVTHSMSAVRSMCDHVVWLDHGRIRKEGAPASVVDAYMAEMHEGRPDLAEGAGARWGSGEVTIDKAQLLRANGKATTSVRTGDPCTIRLHVRSHKKVMRPVFGIGVRTVGGIEVTNPNTREASAVLRSLDGEQIVDLEVPRLLLLPGAYDVSATVTDHSAARTYDFHQRILRFDVEPGKPHETAGGVVSLDGNWRYGG